MLHTIVSLYDIFYEPPEKTETEAAENGFSQYSFENGKRKPVSFFSTNPYDYLGESYLKNNTDAGLK